MQILASVSAEELSIQSGIESLGKLFAIVLALAIGEAFRQFVSDGGETGNFKIRRDRIWALVGFVVLVVPFFHGMARYFFDVYLTPPRPDHYGIFLLFDTFVFTVEAVIFFILARSLDPKDDRRFYKAVQWYRDNGILPHQEGGGPNGTLIVTRDDLRGGIDSSYINRLIEEVLDA